MAERVYKSGDGAEDSSKDGLDEQGICRPDVFVYVLWLL